MSKITERILGVIIFCVVLVFFVWLQLHGGQMSNRTGGLVGLYHFNDGTGADAADSSGNGNHLAITGATWVDGIYRKCLYFFQGDGVDSAKIADNASMVWGTKLTVAAWAKCTNASGARCLVNKDNNQSGREFEFGRDYTGSGITFELYTNISAHVLVISGLPQADMFRWHRFVMVYDAALGYYVAYRDGKEIGRKAASGTVNNGTGFLLIGATEYPAGTVYNAYANVYIDEVAVLANTAWTPGQVARDYVDGVGRHLDD